MCVYRNSGLENERLRQLPESVGVQARERKRDLFEAILMLYMDKNSRQSISTEQSEDKCGRVAKR